MAFQKGVEQRIPFTTYKDGIATAPVNPVATISKDGAGFVACDNLVAHISGGGCNIVASANEMNMDAGLIIVTSDTTDPEHIPIVTESAYTAARAAQLDFIAGGSGNYTLDTTYGVGGVNIVTGSIISGTGADTEAVGTPLVMAPSGTATLDVDFEFEIGTAIPNLLSVIGYYTGPAPGSAASRHANVFAWDWQTSAWAQLSDGANRIADGSSNASYIYILQPQYVSAAGTVKVRYLSSRINSDDRLYIDQHLVNAVAVESGGLTVFEIALGVWAHDVRNRALDGTHLSAGYFLARTAAHWGNVTAVDGRTVTMSGTLFQDVAGLYNGRYVQFHQAGEQIHEVRRIINQAAGGVLTLDKAPVLVSMSNNWHGYVLPETAGDSGMIEGGDWIIDTSDATQYQLVIYAKGTTIELKRCDLLDLNGDPITDLTTVIAGLEEA